MLLADLDGAEQLISSLIRGLPRNSVRGLFLGPLEIVRRQIQTAERQARVKAIRIELNRMLQSAEGVVPLFQALVGLGGLVIGLNKARVNLERIAKLDSCFLILALFHVAASALQIAVLCFFGMAATT